MRARIFTLLAVALGTSALQAVAQVPISALPSATTPLGGTEAIPLVQGGVTKKVTESGLMGAPGPIGNSTPSSGAFTSLSSSSGSLNGSIGLTTPGAGVFTTASGAMNAGTVTATGTTASRSLASRFAEIGDVKNFNAACDGTTDDTAAIQAALSAGLSAVFIPPTTGGCKFTTLTMPVTPLGFTLFGVGPASKLVQTGAGIKWPTNLSIDYHSETIADLMIDGTAGTDHSIDTSYEGGTTLRDLYINNVPVGFDGIHIDGSSTTYTHDVRVLGLQVYSTTAGHAGVGFGAHAADSTIGNMILNGNFAVVYGVYLADGAVTGSLYDSHVYGATTNIVKSDASTTTVLGFQFDNDILDNAAGGDIVSWGLAVGTLFNNVYFEAVQPGHNAITLNNSSGTTISGAVFNAGSAGAGYLVNETGSASSTSVLGGSTTGTSDFTNPPFNFISPYSSVAKNFAGVTPLGQQINFTGSTSAVVTAGSTAYLGSNGAQALPTNSNFNIPLTFAHMLCATVYTDTAPGAGQTATVTLYRNTTPMTAAAGSANPLVISGGSSFGGTICVAQGSPDFLVTADTVYLKVVTSGGAASMNFRYNINVIG